MDFRTELIGLIAAALTTGSFVPQVIKILQTKDTAAISLVTYTMYTVGIALWLAYGLILRSPALILSNSVTFALSALVLALKLRLG